jgi:hypothetical protein
MPYGGHSIKLIAKFAMGIGRFETSFRLQRHATHRLWCCETSGCVRFFCLATQCGLLFCTSRYCGGPSLTEPYVIPIHVKLLGLVGCYLSHLFRATIPQPTSGHRPSLGIAAHAAYCRRLATTGRPRLGSPTSSVFFSALSDQKIGLASHNKLQWPEKSKPSRRSTRAFRSVRSPNRWRKP